MDTSNSDSDNEILVLAKRIIRLRLKLFPENSWRGYLYTRFIRQLARKLIATKAIPQKKQDFHVTTEHFPFYFCEHVESILISKLDHIGDFVLGFAAYDLLKKSFPKAKLTLLCGSWNSELAKASELFDTVVSYNFLPEISGDHQGAVLFDDRSFQALNLPAFDLAIDFRDAHETRFLLTKIDAKFRAGFNSPGSEAYMDLIFPSATLKLDTKNPTHHQTLQTLLASAVIAVHTGVDNNQAIVQNIARHTPAIQLKRVGQGNLIGLNIGSGVSSKNWPLDRYAELGQRLIKEQDATLVLFGSKAQEQESTQLAHALPSERIINLVGKLSLTSSIATMQNLDVYIGNDTGTTHIAASLNIPTLCLFSGLTTFASHGILGKNSFSILAIPADGMSSIKTEAVLDALTQLTRSDFGKLQETA